MSTKKTYALHVGGKKIPVGDTQPTYDPIKKGWVTDKGLFSTPTPSDYMVTAEIVADPAK